MVQKRARNFSPLGEENYSQEGYSNLDSAKGKITYPDKCRTFCLWYYVAPSSYVFLFFPLTPFQYSHHWALGALKDSSYTISFKSPCEHCPRCIHRKVCIWYWWPESDWLLDSFHPLFLLLPFSSPFLPECPPQQSKWVPLRRKIY